MIDFDVVLNQIGHFGRYQCRIVLLVYWLGIPAGLHSIASVFYAAPIEHRCNVPPIDNKTVYPSLNESEILNWTTPFDTRRDQYDTCQRYGYNLSLCDGTESCVNKSAPAIACDKGYYFDTSVFSNTIDTQWEMICDKQVINTAATSLYFAGMWAGAIVFGYTSDKYGRRPTMFICNLGTLVCGILVAFSPWFALFAVARFLVAAFNHGSFLIMCVYVMEIVGKYRTPVGINAHSSFAVGYMLNSLFAYLLRDWRYFYLALSLTSLPYIVFHFFIPESPRWHFSNSREEEGKELSYKFAEKNKKEIPPEVWKEAEADNVDKALLEKTYSSLDLFKKRRMRLITINMMYGWFVVSLVYYGLSLNAGSLAGDIFVNNALNGVMEIFGYVIVTFTMDRLGRRILLAGAFLLGGFACIGSMLCQQFGGDNQAVITTGVVMAFIGKIGAGAGFSIIYNYTAELYPTVVRSNGLGVGSMAARWGSILSPFVILVQDYAPWFPSTLFGVLSIVAGLLAFLFPETNKKKMPQTIEEAELFYKGISLETQDEDSSVAEFNNNTFEGDDIPDIATKF